MRDTAGNAAGSKPGGFFGAGSEAVRQSLVAPLEAPGLHMSRLDEFHISVKAWLIIAALAGVVWGLNALVDGSSMFALLVGPIIMCLWVAAVVVVDRWVSRGNAD